MRRKLVVAIFLVASAARAAPTDDQRRADAKTHFEEGVKAANAGDSKAALAAFRAAYEAYPSIKVQYNIAQSCKALGDNACAVNAYEKYLRESEAPRPRVQQIEGDLKTLVKSVGRITIKSNIPAADILVDDAPVGRTPTVENFALNPGTHKVAVPFRGKPIEKTVKIEAGATASAQIDAPDEPPPPPIPILRPEPKPTPKPEPAALTPTEPEGPKKFPVVPWAIAGGLAVGTVVTGVLASSALSDYQDKKEQFPITRDDLDSAQGTARDLFLITGVLGAGTIIAASIALYATFSTGTATPPTKRVGIAMHPTGVTIGGVFP